jgi:hypothetical protein
MRRTVLLLAVAAVVHTGAAWAYNWPVKPFKRQHPIRANFGDPRTAFLNELDDHGMNGPGAFNFHNGIDIPAKGGQPVYSVASGPVHIQSGETVVVRASDRVVFQYVHVTPVVSEGQFAVAQQTILGYVQPWAGHVHFGELDEGKITNPLQVGHLSPYRDTVKPSVGPIAVRDLSGRELSALGLHGRVLLTAEAYDTSSIPAPEPWRGLPVAPATVSWRLERLNTRTPVIPQTVAVSFREGLPPNGDFWRYYARGSYQNMPRFGTTIYAGMPGRFIYKLAPDGLDTTKLKDGVYILRVFATDIRGNGATAIKRISILN